ncbi:MAG: hypothetical protein EOP81_17285 [Variovorax sp.]|nr:MAG: hypothetical protein EOP81_17285 [Variovorax sp.]
MDSDLSEWQRIALWMLAALAAALLASVVWHQQASRREKIRLINAARVRSGHVPLEIPTVRGSLGTHTDEAPDTLPEWFLQGKGEHAIVDEKPKVRLRYISPTGKKAECVMRVEHLDVRKKFIVGHGDLPGENWRLPLHAIVAARIADTGQRFNIDTWVDAVRVARRRRGEV